MPADRAQSKEQMHTRMADSQIGCLSEAKLTAHLSLASRTPLNVVLTLDKRLPVQSLSHASTVTHPIAIVKGQEPSEMIPAAVLFSRAPSSAALLLE
jgi:hypothetical protein